MGTLHMTVVPTVMRRRCETYSIHAALTYLHYVLSDFCSRTASSTRSGPLLQLSTHVMRACTRLAWPGRRRELRWCRQCCRSRWRSPAPGRAPRAGSLRAEGPETWSLSWPQPGRMCPPSPSQFLAAWCLDSEHIPDLLMAAHMML